jgi:AAA15 family ATPase/GTPase
MLLKYLVKNYKSIAHPIEYSMFPANENIDNKYVVTINTIQGPWKVLRRGVLLGPNASGKSNFIQSLDFARNFIVEAQKSGSKTGIVQFKGEFADIGKDSTFQFMFYKNENVYEYGFTLDTYRVSEEWLMILDQNTFKPIFQRITSDNDVTSVELSSYLGRKNSKKRRLAELLMETLKKNQRNQLFLYKLSENGFSFAEDIMDWFYKIQIIFPSSKVHMLEMRLMQNEDFARFLSSKLIKYDTGIHKIFAQTKKVQLAQLLKDMDISQEIIDEISEKREGLVNIKGRLFIFNEENGEPMLFEMILEHSLAGKSFPFHKDEESDGTQRLLDLLPVLFGLTSKSSVFFIDEIDRCLHTKLTKTFITDFIADEHKNQLIFTAHDVSLINLEALAQDEIWFIEKNRMGESYLKPFSDYAVSCDTTDGYSNVKSYLAGRFGAIPVIKEGLDK